MIPSPSVSNRASRSVTLYVVAQAAAVDKRINRNAVNNDSVFFMDRPFGFYQDTNSFCKKNAINITT